MPATLTRIVDNGGERSQNEGIRSDLTIVYHVAGLTGGAGAEAEVEAIAGFPANGATFGGSGPYASLIKQRHDFDWLNSEKTVARVICRYQSPNGSGQQSGPIAGRLPIIRWGTQSEQVALGPKDFTTGTPLDVKNTAGQPFDPPLVTQILLPYVEVTLWKTQASFNTDVVPLFARGRPVVNSAAFSIDGVSFGIRQLRLSVSSADKEYEGAATYYRVTYRFDVNSDTWDLKPASYGYYEWDSGTSKMKPIVDAEGNPVSVPWPLDSSGVKIANPVTTSAAIMNFKPYPIVSFSVLT